ncbi:MAG: hypothetical protein ABI197_13610 [Granulicella sp.]
MSNPSRVGVSSRILAVFFILLAGNACKAQQTYVSRYDIYTGFSDLNTPALNSLNQVGFHLQAGVNNRSWLSSGFDYSVQTGSTVLTTNLATPALQQQLAALPPGYHLALPIDVNTQTFTIGSQYVYRHFAKTTLFLRPALSAFRIKSVPHPADPIAALVSSEIAPQGEKTDWVGAYGVGGGAEFAASKHLGIRVQLDAVYNHPYNDILGNGNWTYRYSVGPAFHFGRNILDQ